MRSLHIIYIEELDNINERNEYGTDLFIPVFSFASGKMDWKDEVIAEILDNFLYSIYSGKLEIKVDNIILNKDSLLTHIIMAQLSRQKFDVFIMN